MDGKGEGGRKEKEERGGERKKYKDNKRMTREGFWRSKGKSKGKTDLALLPVGRFLIRDGVLLGWVLGWGRGCEQTTKKKGGLSWGGAFGVTGTRLGVPNFEYSE